MKIPFQDSKYKKVRETGLLSNRTSEERQIAWLNAGLSRTATERFYFMTELMKINFVLVNGKYSKQYF